MKNPTKIPIPIPIPKAMRSHHAVKAAVDGSITFMGAPITTLWIGRQVMRDPTPIRDFVHDVWRYLGLRKQTTRKGRPGWRHAR